MLTAGVDLAAEPPGTALAEIEWSAGGARVVTLQLGVTNDEIADAAARVSKLGIDCAFGWPDEFVAFVAGHAAGEPLNPPPEHGIAWRRRLSYRETDRDIQRRTGRTPLSVATDRLGLTAMRCVVILDQIGRAGIPVDRAGAGRVVEVYPAAALGVWGVTAKGSKRDVTVLGELVDGLESATPWMDLGEWVPLMRRSHDAFDAVIAGMIARASAIGVASRPPLELLDQANREGWIALPQGSIDLLVDGGEF